MAKLTYLPREGDFLETEVAGVKFAAGVPVELPAHKTWLAHHLASNPWFKVEIDPTAPVPEMPSTGLGDTSFGGLAPVAPVVPAAPPASVEVPSAPAPSAPAEPAPVAPVASAPAADVVDPAAPLDATKH